MNISLPGKLYKPIKTILMNERRLLALLMLALVSFGFIACEEEDEYSWDNCIERVSTPLKDDYTIYSQVLNKDEVVEVIARKGMDKIETGCEMSIGTSKDNMTKLTDQDYTLAPFSQYYVTYTPYFKNGDNIIYGEEKTVKINAIPPGKYFEARLNYGDGESAANIHWKVMYQYDGEETYKRYDGPVKFVSVTLSSDENVQYKKEPIEFPAETDSCYISESSDVPAYTYRYWKDGKAVMRYFPIVYNFNVKVTIPIGEDGYYNFHETLKGILLDKQRFICDKDYNLYRIAKIGDQIWTIDNAISLKKIDKDASYTVATSNFYGGDEFFFRDWNWISPISGYHQAYDKNWDELFSYYNIEMPQEKIPYNDEEIEKLLAHDPSMQKYFSTSKNWDSLLSEIGWQDGNDNSLALKSGVFNVMPTGIVKLDGKTTCGENEFASLSYGSSGVVLFSKYYNGIALFDRGGLASIRLVKYKG